MRLKEKKWSTLLPPEFQKDYFLKLKGFLECEYQSKKIYPQKSDIFNAFKYTNYKDIKVVILGQDPYHGANQAHGLSFSVQDCIPLPPSLKNIFKELNSDLGVPISKNGNLTKWAKQGVLLLNTTLTVQDSHPNSHQKIGWSIFTDQVIKFINEKDTPVVFLLWGNNARAKKSLITNAKHLILEAVHPSPLSAHRGFFGCGHFSKANNFLKKYYNTIIDWDLTT